MLKIENISKIEIYSDEWHMLRCGKMTSSRISCLMTDKEFAQGAITYIEHKVGESIAGQPSEEEEQLEDENTAWGNQYEPDLIREFQKRNNVQFLATQKLIHAENTRFSSTPDAIWIHSQASNQKEYNVSTFEGKCPRKYHRFLKLYKCKTAIDLYNTDKKYFWQVVDQMDNCDSAIGYFAAYHPMFPPNANYRQIEFKKMELWDYFKLLRQRKLSADKKFNELRAEILNG